MQASRFLALLAFIVIGCIETDYQIEMTPAGDALDRELKLRRQFTADGAAPDDELTRLAQEYAVEPPRSARGKNFRFRARFAGRMPDDVGGYGTFARWDSPLGAAAVYIERFRGNDDVAAELKQRQIAADRVAEILLGWLESELRDEPQWPTLRRFVDENFRRDLHNLSIYAWTLGMTPVADDHLPEPIIRTIQYLVERDYLAYEDIPQLNRMLSQPAAERNAQILKWVRRIILARLHDEAPKPELHFLASPEQLSHSLSAYLETTAEYAILENEWRTELTESPHARKPDPLAVVSTLVWRVFLGAAELGGDRLTVVLNTGRAVVQTNGSWVPESGQISWAPRSLPASGQSPVLLYAVWAEPNVAAQTKSFGTTVLQGRPLVEYCVWYRGLNDDERSEWDVFLDNLRPGPQLPADLRAFRLANERRTDKSSVSLAGTVVESIVRELSGAPSDTP